MEKHYLGSDLRKKTVVFVIMENRLSYIKLHATNMFIILNEIPSEKSGG